MVPGRRVDKGNRPFTTSAAVVLPWAALLLGTWAAGCEDGSSAPPQAREAAVAGNASGKDQLLIYATASFGEEGHFAPKVSVAVINGGQVPLYLDEQPGFVLTRTYYLPRRGHSEVPGLAERARAGAIGKTVLPEPRELPMGDSEMSGGMNLSPVLSSLEIPPGGSAVFKWQAQEGQYPPRTPDEVEISVIARWRTADGEKYKRHIAFRFSPPGTTEW